MIGHQFSAVDKDKDLGVMVASYLKPGQSSLQLVKAANILVGFIGRVLLSKSEKVILKL